MIRHCEDSGFFILKMQLMGHWSVLVAWVFLPLISASSKKCGTGYPTRFLSYGQTASTTAAYGTALGPFLAPFGPVLDGCNPISGETGVQVPLSKMQFDYSTVEQHLVERARSNDTLNLGEYTLRYQAVPDHLKNSSVYSLRPTLLRLFGSESASQEEGVTARPQSDAAFSYDDKGRLSHVRWLYLNHSEESHHLRVGVPAEHIAAAGHRLATTSGTNGVGEETFVYDDPDHPEHPTLYRSNGCLGKDAIAYSYQSRPDGAITGVNRSRFVPAATCEPACGADSFCCRSVSGGNDTAWCSAKSCSAMGHRWTYVYDGDRIVSLHVDGQPAQDFTYDDTRGGVLTHVQQNTTTKDGTTKSVNMMTVEYDDAKRAISGILAFVIYPFAPEVWGLAN